MTRFSLLLMPVLLGSVLSGPAPGQDGSPARLTLLALGEHPPFRQEIRGGMRIELDPSEGSIPPRSLEATPTDDARGRDRSPTFRVQLGVRSQTVEVLPREGKVELSKPGGDPWIQLPCPVGSSTLAVLWRPGESWDNPKSISLPELKADHDPRSFRFLNVAPAPVGIVFGEERITLDSGSSRMLSLPAGAKAVSVTVFCKVEDGRSLPCFSGIAGARNGSTTEFFIHRADSERPRRPVAVTPVSRPLGP